MPDPGTIEETAYDKGVVEHLGAIIEECTLLDGRKTYSYVVSIDGVTGDERYNGKVPISIIPVSTAYHPDIVPSIAIRPGEPTIADDRLLSLDIAGRWAAPGAKEVTVGGVSGFDRYQIRRSPLPVDFTYEIIMYAPKRNIGLLMRSFLLKKFPKHESLSVQDSVGDTRTYEMHLESIFNNSELASIAERIISYTFSVRIVGEIDVFDIETNQAATSSPTIGITTA